MDEQSPKEEEPYNFLSINRGRYLCPQHGSFCDSSDNYLDKCPLCKDDEGQSAWQINKIDRLLQVIGGLQNRSKRNVTLLASLIGGIGLLRLVDARKEGEAALLVSPAATLFVAIAVVALIFSLAMYSRSMGHVRTTDQNKPMEKSLTAWECYFASHLEKMEVWHAKAGCCFVAGALFLVGAIVLQTVCSIDIGQSVAKFCQCLDATAR